MRFWWMMTLALVLAVGPGSAQAQDARQIFEQAVDALGDLVPSETQRQRVPPAEVPADPPLPMPRPDDRQPDEAPVEPEPVAEEDAAQDETMPLPEPRPDAAEPGDQIAVDDEVPVDPDRIYQAACPAVLSGLVEADMLPPIEDGQCGLQSPLHVTAVTIANQRVPLSQPATVNCAMAGELARWAGRVDVYTQARFNAGVAEILSGTSYFCRGRNNVEDADISEHGFGNAMDVTGFVLDGGTRISLPDDWGDDSAEADAMSLAHDTACGFFTTVLGPDANALHADHLHLDLGCHGRTCTARLCQ